MSTHEPLSQPELDLIRLLLSKAPPGTLEAVSAPAVETERVRRPLLPPAVPTTGAARPRRRAHVLGWSDIPFHLAALALAGGLWALGGYLTLTWLHDAGAPITARLAWPWELGGTALLAWLIPLGVSALELGFDRRRGLGLLVFIAVAVFDLVTTAAGMHVWGLARGLPLDTAAGLAAMSVAAAGLTFLPERIALTSARALWAILT